MQQARATVFGVAALALGQRLALQPAQLAEQDRNLARLPGALLDIAGELLQRLAQFPRQVQGQQLLGQFAESIDVLLGALLAALFGVEHGLFQARNQARQAGVHVVATEDLAQLLHALVDRLESFLGHLGDAHAGYTDVLDNARGFDQSLREQVSGLQASVQQATDLNSLKLAVDSRLNGLLASMDEHQREQAEHEQEVSGRLQALMERVNSMEQDAKAFHSHLEDQRQKALTDPLTGLPNRAALSERLEQEVARRHRDGGDLLLAVLDIDHFKRINDDFGHLAGDKVLKIIAGELRKRLRQADFIARFGGEEFVVLLPATSLEAGRQLLERLRAAIAACPFHFKGEPLSITCSAGITAFEGNEAGEAVFERADQALYRAKRAGRDRLEVA